MNKIGGDDAAPAVVKRPVWEYIRTDELRLDADEDDGSRGQEG